jgi:hypothetical protein
MMAAVATGDGPTILALACQAISDDRVGDAALLLAEGYPFDPVVKTARRYTPLQSTAVFFRDGYIDRYSGRRLVFPGTLRLISRLIPGEFPFHPNWRSDACHFAYYELFPTIDHLVPVARGGDDIEENWISTSMVRNATKANFTTEELGWRLHPPGNLADWDGLTGWFISQAGCRPGITSDSYLSKWLRAAKQVTRAN